MDADFEDKIPTDKDYEDAFSSILADMHAHYMERVAQDQDLQPELARDEFLAKQIASLLVLHNTMRVLFKELVQNVKRGFKVVEDAFAQASSPRSGDER